MFLKRPQDAAFARANNYRIIDSLSFDLSNRFLDFIFQEGFGRVLYCMGGCHPSKLPLIVFIQDY